MAERKPIMNCDEIRPLIDALVDRELALETSLSVERHLSSCDACMTIYQNRAALQTATSTGSLYAHTPEELSSQIMMAIRQQAQQAEPEPARSFLTARGRMIAWSLAAALVIAAILTARTMYIGTAGPPADDLAQEVFTSDMRSLMAVDHGIDILSSNQHTVKPWFAGKLDFSPPVRDYSADGFPLIGGRRDYLNGRTVAALVYRRRKHWINAYIWPSSQDLPTTALSKNGYNIVHWSENGMNYWVVSDLNAPELNLFTQLLRSN
jgi:anti-sigma factor RsiW